MNSLPSPPQLVDQASAAYTFQVPDGRTVTGSASSNTLSIPVTTPNVTVVKSAGFTDVTVGDILLYTSVISNNGIAAVTNVSLSDTIPAGTSLVPGSVTVVGVSQPSANPGTGIAVGTIAPGSSVAVTFQVNVISLPSPAQLLNKSSASFSSGAFTGISVSNTTTTPVYQPVIQIAKSSNVSSATVGGNILYTLNVQNSGNIGAAVTLSDNIPSGSTFVSGSVTVNGVARPADSPLTGINLGTLASGAAVPVTFLVSVQSLPAPPVLNNQGNSNYTYQLPSGRSFSGTSLSNTLTIPVSAPNITLTKTANLTNVAVGENLTYSVIVSNPSSVTVTNVVVSDPIPTGELL